MKPITASEVAALLTRSMHLPARERPTTIDCPIGWTYGFRCTDEAPGVVRVDHPRVLTPASIASDLSSYKLSLLAADDSLSVEYVDGGTALRVTREGA